MIEPLPEELLPKLVEQMRQNLNIASATTQILNRAVQQLHKPQYDEYLAILNQSIYQMIRALNDLTFAQLPEGEVKLREQDFDLVIMCRALMFEASYLAERAGVKMDPEPRLDGLRFLPMCGDSGLLERMLLHLLSNAIRAAGEGGQVGVSIAFKQRRAVITVWDTGPGLQLPPDAGEGYLLPRMGGLGLGLGVARRIARLHGGTLVLEQRENRGCGLWSLPVRSGSGQPGDLHDIQVDLYGGYSEILVELSTVLPYKVFLPSELE